jgi:hypothetical protein
MLADFKPRKLNPIPEVNDRARDIQFLRNLNIPESKIASISAKESETIRAARYTNSFNVLSDLEFTRILREGTSEHKLLNPEWFKGKGISRIVPSMSDLIKLVQSPDNRVKAASDIQFLRDLNTPKGKIASIFEEEVDYIKTAGNTDAVDVLEDLKFMRRLKNKMLNRGFERYFKFGLIQSF